METEFMLTTTDNPYNPFEQFALWNLFDKEHGHNTCELIARLSKISFDMTQKEENEDYDRVVEFIIMHDPHDKYKKFFREEQKATVTNA